MNSGLWKVLYFFCISLLILCSSIPGQERTINNTISTPAGYSRIEYAKGSFSHWVQSLGLKKDNKVLSFDSTVVQYAYYNIYGVVEMPLLFKRDLEQCADYCMRFWAEYHKSQGKLDKLYLFDYSGNKKKFKDSKKSYKSFLKWAFAYSNSYSLKKGCSKILENELKPGDIIVQNRTGGIGHVSVIMDVCESKEGEKLYLIGYSFMPAQEFHIEKAEEKYGKEGWFTIEGYFRYLSDFFDFGKPILRRFLHI